MFPVFASMVALSACAAPQRPTGLETLSKSAPSPLTKDFPTGKIEAYGGYYASDGEFIYFVNPNDGDALYRMTVELTDLTRLDGSKCDELFIDREYLYYSAWNPDVSQRTSPFPDLCRIRKDGTERTVLAQNSGILGLTGYGVVFKEYNPENSYSQMKVIQKDGSGAASLVPMPDLQDDSFFVVTPEFLFYSNLSDEDVHGLYRVNLDGTGRVKLSDDYAWWTNVRDGVIYYSVTYFDGTGKIVRMNIDGSQREIIAEGRFGRLHVTDEWIYCVDYAQEPNGLYRMRHDGTEKAELFSTEGVYAVNCVAGMVFFNGIKGLPVYYIPAGGTQEAVLLP